MKPTHYLQALVELFFPIVCAGCENPLSGGEEVICTDCRHDMPLTWHHKEPENEAFRKFYGRLDVKVALSLLYFKRRGKVRNMIHKLKYNGREEVGKMLGDWMGADLKKMPFTKEVDYIIPVPLHPKRFRERGYNQVTAFGRALAEQTGIAFAEDLLFKKTYLKTQSKKSLLERAKVSGKDFHVVFSERHHGCHFLLVDDVLTTGATLESCGKALLEIPNAKLSVATMAFASS